MMKNAPTSILLCAGLALGLTLSLCSPTPARGAEPAASMTLTPSAMGERCEKMKEQKQQMRADMKVHDAKLTKQLVEMNSAPASRKVDLMAALLTHMVEQRIAMDARKATMEDEMMQHMMQHVQMGKDGMAQCPMLKDMKEMKDMKGKSAVKGKAAEAHEMHQVDRK